MVTIVSITAKVKYVESVRRFLLSFTAIFTSIAFCESEGGDFVSISSVIKVYQMLPQMIDPFPPEVKDVSQKISHHFWNGHSIGRLVTEADATKKMLVIERNNVA